jgi:hypothetical protein
MAHRVLLLVPLLLVGCASSRPTARQLDVRLEAEIWLAAGQSNMEVFADRVPPGAEPGRGPAIRSRPSIPHPGVDVPEARR